MRLITKQKARYRYSKSPDAQKLKAWYFSLPRHRMIHNTARELICERLNINSRIFWSWIRGEAQIPYVARQVINDVAGEKLFDVAPITTGSWQQSAA